MPTLEEADRACALARERGRAPVVNNQYRFMDIHRQAQARIGRPEFGELLFVTIEQSFFTTKATEAGWRGQDPRRTWKEFGTHVLDLCRFFFGEEPRAVTARMRALAAVPGDGRRAACLGGRRPAGLGAADASPRHAAALPRPDPRHRDRLRACCALPRHSRRW